MASNVVASVAVLIRPITKGFKKNIQDAYKDAVKEIQPEVPEEGYEEQGRRSGNRFAQAFGRWAKRALVTAGVAIGAAVGASVVSGFRSAINQQQGQLVLSGLYGDAEKARKTLEGIRGVSSTSPIDYSAYQGAAESLAYAGVEGDQAISVLENVGKAVTAAGGDSSNIDRASDALLKGVNAGKFQLDTLQQLSDAGIPILSGLADHFGVSIEEVNKMASAGQVGLDDVLAVMENGTGDVFQQMIAAGEEASKSFSNQWKIAKDNVAVALGQVMLPLIEMLAPMIKPAADAMVGFIEEIPSMLDGIRDGVQWVKDNIAWIGTLAGTLVVAGTAAWVASGGLTAVGLSITGMFTALKTGIRSIPVIGWIITGIGLLVTALVWFFTQTEAGQAIWEKVWGAIKTAASAVWDWIQTTLWPGMVAAWDAISSAAVWMYENAILPAWNGIRTVAGVVWDWVSGTLWPGMVAAWDAIASGAIWLYENAILPAWNGIKTAIEVVGGWITGTLWPAIQTAWEAIGAVATWLYESIIQPVWTGIRVAIAIAVTAVLTAMDLMKWAFDTLIAPVAMWLWNKVFVPVWEGIRGAVDFAVTAVNAYIDLLKWYFENVIAPVAMWLWRNVFSPVWEGIKIAVQAFVTWFSDTAWPWLNRTAQNIQTAFNVLRDALQAAWAFIRDRVINPVVTWLRDVAWARIISPTLNRIRTAFNVLRDALQAAWNFIRDRVINPVVTWLRDVAWARIISPTLNRIRDGFNTLRNRIRDAWNFIRDRVINPVATWFRDTIEPLFDRATSGIEDAFTSMRDVVRKAWNAVRDTAKAPVEFVVNKIINDAIIDNYNSVASTFGLDEINDVRLPSGWRKGGILPGYTPMRHGDDVLTPMRSGEGVLVSEGLRDQASRSLFLAANEAAKRGASFADFLTGGYAGGGLVKLRMPFSGTYPRGEGFGTRGGRHKGIDWPMPHGAVLKAVAAGVANRTRNAAAGNKLELSIGNGLVAGYHHLSSFIARQGQSVGRGADVARVGSTGRSSGPHLHFSLAKDGRYVDPAPYLGAGGEAGSGGGGWNPFTGLWESLKDRVREGVGDSAFGDLLFEVPKKLIGGALSWVTDKITALGDWAGEQVSNATGFARWSPVATQALVREGQYGPRRFSSLMRRMNQESGYDPRAINNWDSNARRGTPSKGLMQVIQPTFDAYRDRSLSSDIYNPLANIVASIRYTLARYGDLERGWNRAGGYAGGGIVAPTLFDSGGVLPPGLTSVLNASRKPEAVLTNEQMQHLRAVASGRGGEQPRILIEQLSALDTDDAVRKLYQKDHQVRAHYGPGVMV